MKVACEQNGWGTYLDSSGSLVESTHDYGVIYFNDYLGEPAKTLIKKPNE